MRREAVAGFILAGLSLLVAYVILLIMTDPSSSSSDATRLRASGSLHSKRESIAEDQTVPSALSTLEPHRPAIELSSDTGLTSLSSDDLIASTGAIPQDQPKVMYTFYSPIEGKKQTGMTDQDNKALLNAWKTEWSTRGWEPRVITLDTARQHPDFERLNAMMDGLPFQEYDRFCFLRWLAMAVVGGGWQSDYDTFPLHAFDALLPNAGRLTVHEPSKNGGVPDLVSGNAKEWYRMAVALIENAVEHKSEPHWSDMFAMQSLFVESGGSIYTMEKNVVPGQVILKDGKTIEDDRVCRRASGKYAVHFSHYAIENGNVKEGSGPQHRAEIATEWLRSWRDACFKDSGVAQHY